jgi:dTDP-4-dehydrorhamnose reductase
MILVTGANGQVGSEINYLAKAYPFEFIFTDAADLDITNNDAVFEFFSTHEVTHVINCAAYTAVDKAEEDQDLAAAVNVTGAMHLAQACTLRNIPLVHISTDYVYHNSQNTPFVEDDQTNPQGVYAATKLEGEEVIKKIHPRSMIIRTSWVYSTFGNNFVKTMLRLGKDRDELKVIFDQIGSPTYARDLAKGILDILHKLEQGDVSDTAFNTTYHYSNEGVCSWYDFAKAIFEMSNIECEVSPIVTAQYPTPAKRPPFSLLNKAKIREAFDLEIPYWRDSLSEMLSHLD